MAKGSYPWYHRPGELQPPVEVGVPPLDDELEGVLDDTAGVHPGVDMIRDGIRLLALDALTADQTQTILSTIAGNGTDLLAAFGLLVQRLTNADSNPALDGLDAETAKQVELCGERFAYELAEFAPRDHTGEAAALIDRS
ncbi:hypothetical protein [Streptomyces showdoensis]|uniref:Uncharacterized protein n=1 Tax=Streptomyces showdoensis TaxID=68268 RepID=A0A2P2GKL2_STREW|nr:hypothetical protein [Streptomyces showdoensis]KKZ72046.1 hypothetical protein VO63_19850 [Streptomyces showdoensis]